MKWVWAKGGVLVVILVVLVGDARFKMLFLFLVSSQAQVVRELGQDSLHWTDGPSLFSTLALLLIVVNNNL